MSRRSVAMWFPLREVLVACTLFTVSVATARQTSMTLSDVTCARVPMPCSPW